MIDLASSYVRSCLTTWCVDAGADPEGGVGGGPGGPAPTFFIKNE